MATKTYDGYRITELRRYATEYKIAGRSKMTGDELLVAVRAVWGARREAAEWELLAAVAVKPGTVLRHKSSGDIIRVTSKVKAWSEVNDALYVEAEYVECDGWGVDRRAERAAYDNARDARTGHVSRHPLWQYEAVPPVEPKTVTLAELTQRLGLDEHGQQGVRAFCDGEAGPWTEDEAASLAAAWQMAAGHAADDDPECDDLGQPFFAADGALVTPGAEPLTAEGAEALAVRAGFAPAPTDMPCLAMVGDKRYSGNLRAAKGHEHLIATGPECNDAWPVPDMLTPAERAFVTELQTEAVPAHPEGTPEHAAYAAELKTELGKFARGEDPYPFTDVLTGPVAARALAATFGGAVVDPADALPTPAPTFADDVAALRREIKLWAQQGDTRYGDCVAILDRIEARAPQRATDRYGDLLWQHSCGHAEDGEAGLPPNYCGAKCSDHEGDWQALYVIEGGE